MISPLLATLMPEPSTIVRPGPALPVPRANVTIRPGTLADVPFMDSLQKLHTRQVGWMPRAQFEGKIALGHVLIAEERVEGIGVRGQEDGAFNASSLTPAPSSPLPSSPISVGYCIGNDQYFKRDDVGIIYQMNVLPGRQRGFVGAALLKVMFERSAYGCKLFCCWCAQDIAANRFWEAMGFVPLAFRAGSRTKGKDANGKTAPRVHVFWQKRIREGDTTTPWWFPSQTGGGSIREDRIVLPIPPGTHWSDAKPMILPGAALPRMAISGPAPVPELPPPKSSRSRKAKAEAKPEPAEPTKVIPPHSLSTRGLRFGTAVVLPAVVTAEPVEKAVQSPKKQPEKKTKNDPRLVAAARELRDRWLDEVNATPLASVGKYDVTRAIDTTPAASAIKRLAA